jgi:DNA-directed RNA polymerase subunit RPC12/RpoP
MTSIINKICGQLFGYKPCPYCLSKNIVPNGVGHRRASDGRSCSIKLFKCIVCGAEWSFDGENITIHENGKTDIKSTDPTIQCQMDDNNQKDAIRENIRNAGKNRVRT